MRITPAALLLLGLLGDAQSLAAGFLQTAGADVSRLRPAVLAALDAGEADEQ